MVMKNRVSLVKAITQSFSSILQVNFSNYLSGLSAGRGVILIAISSIESERMSPSRRYTWPRGLSISMLG